MERMIGEECVSYRWIAPSRKVQGWVVEHIRNSPKLTRTQLANELRVVRKEFGTHAAREYFDYCLWLGIYPGKRA